MYSLATNRTEKYEWGKRYITLFGHRQTPCGLNDGCYLCTSVQRGMTVL